MKLWNKIKSWIVKPYMKPLVLKNEIKVADLQYKTKAELEKLAFQRLSKNIIKAGENKHNGIRFFLKS